ncbi:Innexin inx3 [Orchesella cincta]|uniref:Innexin n=1 Tax=Orchesella cincta TaxID=48709 RepID=A0A1D2N3Z4_ORCCI|nr:Innexin inx3 [Orchesella cincta]
MADLLKALSIAEVKSKFRVRLDKVIIENRAFRLFSRVTAGCLFLCAGKHIDCINPPKEDIRPEALNQYCFIMGTYTVPELYNLTVGIDIAHPGVGTFHFDDEENSQQQYHTWYQWVPIAFFFQGITFLLPHMLWKALEKDKIKSYCDLEVASSVNLKTRSLNDNSDPEKKRKTISKAAVYFVGTMSYNNFYAFAYIFCEILNVVVLAFNFYFTDCFLGAGDFANYGPEVVSFSKLEDSETEGLISPMDRIFPKVTKCDFHKYGPSGG